MKKLISMVILIGLVLSTANIAASFQTNNADKYNPDDAIAKNKSTDTVSDDISRMINETTEENVKNYLTELVNIYPERVVGSKNCTNARNYIHDVLKINSKLNVSTERWKMWGYDLRYYSGANVLAYLPGTSDNPMVFVFLVHHDCSKDSPGADDDGSGVAALLTAASVMSKYTFKNTILFCSSEGEEKGLLGDYYHAKWSYKHDINIAAAIAADAIGYNEGDKPGPNSVILYKPERSNWISDLILNVNNTYSSEIGLVGIAPGGYPQASSGDGAYENYGYYNLKFFEGITNPGWEQPPYTNDTLDKINFSYLTNVTKLIVGALATLADMQELEPEVKITFPKEDRRYINGRTGILPLTKGVTKVRGSIKVEAEAKDGISYVNFTLLKGYNEGAPENRQVLAWKNVTSESSCCSTYEWVINYNKSYLGENTIRVTAYDINNNYKSDEIEVKFCFTIYIPFLERIALLER